MLKRNLFSMLVTTMVFVFIILTGANIYSQDSTMAPTKMDAPQNDVYMINAKQWTNQLNQKVTLTQEQQTRIQGILVDYQQAIKNISMDKREQIQTTYDGRIESVLNDNQKKMYTSYKDDWWKGMSTTPSSENKSGY